MQQTEMPHPPKSTKALRRVYIVLGCLAFIQLMAVGIALTLKLSSPPPPVIQQPVPDKKDPVPDKPQPPLPDELITSIRPRTVEEMLRDADQKSSGSQPSVIAPPVIRQSNNVQDYAENKTRKEPDIPLPPQLAQLLKEARYAQIEGDMRKSVLKLEEASALEPGNPVLLYYFGLAYEALRNAEKSREYFLKVFTMRDKAGKYCQMAAKHLETGFEAPSDRRGDMAFGTILEYKEENAGDGQRVVLTIPILMKEGLNIRPEDLYIPILFYDSVNGRKIELTRAEEPQVRWMSEPVDWADGEETLEVRYHMPPLTEEAIAAYGDLKYFGFTAKLYYKGEPMDCYASPRVLFLIEQMQMKKPDVPYQDDNYGEGLLPPKEGGSSILDAQQMSDFLPAAQ